MEDVSGRKAHSARARHFIFHCPVKSRIMNNNNVVEILLIEDNMDDAGLTIRTLQKHHLANHLLHLQDGEEALQYLFRENGKMPKIILLDLKMPKVDGIE